MKIFILFFVIFAILEYSCSPIPDNCICTTEFRFYAVYIIDNNQQAIDSLVTWVTDKKTGLVIRTDSSLMSQYLTDEGEYIVLTDGEMGFFSTIPRPVIFHASNQYHNITQQFYFCTDDCKCHLVKITGPDSIGVN